MFEVKINPKKELQEKFSMPLIFSLDIHSQATDADGDITNPLNAMP